MTKIDQAEPVALMPLQEAHIREFLSKGVITRVTASGKADGFELHVHIGSAVGALVNARGTMRTFSSLNTLAGLVKRLGADGFDVVIGGFSTSEPSAQAPASK
jgi:hypothetical protein